MKKSQIFQQFNPHFEVFFTYNNKKYNLIGTSTNELNHTFHEVLNPLSGNIKTIPHSILAETVDFENKPILLK